MNLFLTSELLAQMDFYIAIVAPFSHQDFFDVEWRAFNIVRIHIYVFIQQKCMSLATKTQKTRMAADPISYLFLSSNTICARKEKKMYCLQTKASNY